MNIHIGLGCASLLTLANAFAINTTPNPGFHNCGFNLSATCNDKMELFADGDLLATSDYWKVTTVVHIPPNTQVLQISCIDGWILGGILASSDNGLVTNGAWNCSSDNGTTWHPAHELWSNEMTMPEISSEAKWIWTNRPTWTHTQMRPHTTAICKIDLPTSQCCPLFTNSTPSTTPIPTPFATTTTQAPSTPTPGFNLTATCDDKMKLFADGNLLATSSNWRNSSRVMIPANTQIIEIHCIDTGILGGILASSANGLITDGAWICSSDNGTTWSPAYKVGPNGNAVPEISPDAEWIWTGWIGDWTSKYTGQTHCNNCICKVILGAIDGAWSTWSSFSSCSATCGGATKLRIRTCSNPPPSNGGRPCPGLEEEVVNCGLSKCGSYETEMLIQLDTSTAFVTANLSSIQKENCTKEMKITMKEYKETEDIIKKLRFKKPFIRSTELTDRLGSDSRLFTALKQTITQVSTAWTPNGTAERLIHFMSEKFQKWAKKGGGLSILETRSGYEKSEDGDLICSALLQYRRIDGKCNNLAVTDQGSAGIALRRFISNKYEDGESTPRGGLTNSSLPSARVVSRKIHHANNPNPLTRKGYTLMAMQFGQFLDHDVTLTADMEMECCDPEILSNYPSVCFNIDITGDDFYSGKTTCHSFTRSVGIVSDTGVKEQINGITAYIDASNVYGSDDVLAKNLRTLVNGRLKTHADGPMLPTRRQANLESKGPAQLDEDLVAGDMRAIEQPTLASIHSLFLNEHNRIADELRSRLSNILSNKNQSEQDEIIYQESRKLVGAEMQNIVYNEFLPIVLGQDELTKHNLQLSATTVYDDQIDPSIRNEFATVAFRFGHSLIAGMFNGNGGHRLKLTYFDESPEFVSGRSPNNNGRAWYSELTETSKQTSPAGDVFCTEDVTNFLFSNTRGGATNFGDDLAARNIQRGRDHGLPPYNEFRTFCGLSPLKDFHKKPKEITAANWAKLKKAYNRVNDIDAWTGGLAETAPSDGLVGPTFACIIGKQFNFLKFGDRFFFNNDNGNGLKVKSRETIARRNLGDIICDNTDATVLQTYVMLEEDAISNPQRKCSSRNSLDFDAITSDITDEAKRLVPVIDRGWSEWSEFSLCNATCGDATKSRTRTCTIPSASNGGTPCLGSEEEVVSCGLGTCGGYNCPYTDKYMDCAKWKNHCLRGQFEHCMNENCPKTCKCTAETTTTTTTTTTIITTITKTTTTTTSSTTTTGDCSSPPTKENGRWECCENQNSCYLKCNPGYASLFTSTTCSGGSWTDPDKMECEPSVFLLLGGYTNENDSTEIYHPGVEHLTCHTDSPKLARSWTYHATFLYNDLMYICGGFQTENLCLSRNMSNQPGQWKSHNISTANRYGHSAVVIQNKVYFIGGRTEARDDADNVWTYLPLENEPTFTPIPNLSKPGHYLCTVKISEDCFVVVGGFNDGWKVTKYNVTGQSSTDLPRMRQHRFLHSCVMVEEGGKQWIVVAGGWGPGTKTERLDLNDGTQWEELGQTSVYRAFFKMTETRNGIIVMGGYSAISSIELLDWENQQWKLIEPRLKTGRHNFGLVEIPASLFTCDISNETGQPLRSALSVNSLPRQAAGDVSDIQNLIRRPGQQDFISTGLPGLKLQFELKGKTGMEKVKISVDGKEKEFRLKTEWRLFSYPRPSSGSFSVEFLNDIGYTDVFIRGHESQVTNLLPNFPTNKFLGCGTKKEDKKCVSLREGTLMWNGKYTYTLKG